MKNITFCIAIIFSSYLTQNYGEEILSEIPESNFSSSESTLSELEQELLSFEDELLNSEDLLIESPDTLSFSDELEQSSPSSLIEETPFLSIESPAPLFLSQEESPLFVESQEPLFISQEENQGDDLLPLMEETAPLVAYEDKAPSIALDPKIAGHSIEVSFKQVFEGSPLIYSILFAMSLVSIAVSLYSTLRIKSQSRLFNNLSKEIRIKLLNNNFLGALDFCENNPSLLSRMVSSGLMSRKHGLHAVLENMKAEGKRSTISSWQQLGILQDIAVIAPMLGLLGTVVGLFYAFYDLNRSFNSITNLLDGLGVSVGTTVAGIGVAILSMLLHSAAKFRLVRSLVRVESEATSLAHLMDEKN